jgi:hypothetical protein
MVTAKILFISAISCLTLFKQLKESEVAGTIRIFKNENTLISQDSSESFSKFYNLFFSDKEYQLSRIIFPLKCVILNEDNTYKTFYKNKSKWQFSTLKDSGLKVKTLKNTKSEIVINFQISDTGFYVNYYFKKSNGKWLLVKMYDESW